MRSPTRLIRLVLLAVLAGGALRGSFVLGADAALPHSSIGDEPVRNVSPAQSDTQQAPVTPQSESVEYGRVLGALAVVIGLILVLRWCGKWIFPVSGRRGGGKVVEVVSRSPLSPKQQIIVIRVGRRLVVVGDSGSQMNSLCEITDPDEIASLVGQVREQRTPATAGVFGSIFGKSRRDFDAVAPASTSDVAAALNDAEPEETEVASAREELSGLRERVRLIAEQFNG